MPEYLAPGVYVEETSFRSKSIEGVSTTTTGFIGAARYGPIDIQPDVITSLGEFERTYGDRQQLEFSDSLGTTKTRMHKYLWHAARGFFEEGGSRLYVVRVFKPISADDDGYSDAWLPQPSPLDSEPDVSVRPDSIRVRSRFPGAASGMRVRLTLRLGQNVFSGTEDDTRPNG